MGTFRIRILAIGAVAVFSTATQAQEREKLVPEEGAIQVMLLRQPSVREALKLTPTEARRIDEFTAQQWKKAQQVDELSPPERKQKFLEMSQENDRFLDQILKPEQRKRLNQITIQVAGLIWVTRPEVARELKLTEEQKRQAAQYQKEARKEMQDLIYADNPADKNEKLRELRATSRKRLLELLTDAQEVQWKEMAGEPFQGELRFGTAQESGR